MQPTSLKALANKVLERNRHCNQDATVVENQCNFKPQKNLKKLHGSYTGKSLFGELPKASFDSQDSMPERRFSGITPPARKRPRRQAPRLVSPAMLEVWRTGRRWILDHLSELQQAGWTRAELLRAGRLKHPYGTWGVAWFWKVDCTPTLEANGTIKWTWNNANEQAITQTMKKV